MSAFGKVAILIPARMAATRFPGKPLSSILGKPMIQWVYERSKAAGAHRVIVATDSREILDTVRAFGGEAAMTRSDHGNGTDRIAEVAAGLEEEWVINVQGDEPALHPGVIALVVDALRNRPELQMCTVAEPIDNHQQLFDPNVVKVVLDQRGDALYFSRSPIPFVKHSGMSRIYWEPDGEVRHLRHLGIYGYRTDFLLRYVREPPCPLERIEGLEQLRALHMGTRIHVSITHHSSIGVDTPADITKAEAFLKREGYLP